MEIKLSSYVKKIEAKYMQAREKFEKITKDLVQAEADYKALDRNMYSSEGWQKKCNEYDDKKRALLKEYKKVREEFAQAADNIKAESNKIFDRKYIYMPEQVDPNGLTILEKGNPSEREIVRLGNDYKAKGNSTMLFICAERLKESQDDTIRRWAVDALRPRKDRSDHKVIDSFVESCNYGLRDDAMLSDAYHNKVHDNALVESVKAGDTISVTTVNPWEE